MAAMVANEIVKPAFRTTDMTAFGRSVPIAVISNMHFMHIAFFSNLQI
jgi:hypothetical protein